MTSGESPQATSENFLKAIDLEPAPAEFFDQAFTAVPQSVPWPKAYGGDLVAQAAVAAMRSVDSDRVLHSMHSYFMRPGEILAPVRYEVEHVRDGRSFSTRQVRAFQNGKAIYVALASFHVPEDGGEYSAPLPASWQQNLPEPESLPSSRDALAGVSGAAAEYWSNGRSFDMRHVPSPIYVSVEGELTAHQAIWIKAFDTLPDDANVQRAALAYVCDYTILEPLLRQQGLAWGDPSLVTASLDHSLWLHRAGRVDDWVLYVQEAISTQRSRGLANGRFYSRSGVLLASVAQEGMIRHS
jgi:acyl-CoA thioesterase-2